MLETKENIRIECTIIKWESMGKGHNSVKHSENLICILTVKLLYIPVTYFSWY